MVPEVQPGAEEYLPSSYLLSRISASYEWTLTSGLTRGVHDRSPGTQE